MKIVLKLILPILLAAIITGCKKYGYQVPDGYDEDTLKQSINVDTSLGKPDYSMLGVARLFPGLVDKDEPRLQNQQVTMNFNYVNERYDRLRISVLPQPTFSTGFYAAPGEPVIIELPPNAKGLTCQIGAWTDDLSAKASPKRTPVVYSRHVLLPGRKNYVRNLLGGNIYINAYIPIEEPITITFSNVCKAPDFYAGKTDPAQWKQDIFKSKVPWFEFASDYMIFTLPTEKMVTYLQRNPNFDPVANMKGWNDIVLKDYYEWQGLSDTASDSRDIPVTLPWRIVLDDDISVGYGHNGYPIMAINDWEWFGGAVTGNVPVGMWGTLHELGHNNQQGSTWSWPGLGETTCNLFSFKRAERLNIDMGSLHGTEWFQEALNFVKSGTGTFDNATPALSPFHKIVPFLQIYHKTRRWDNKGDGWDFMPYLYTRARHAERFSYTDIDKHDFLYEALCEFTGKDCYKFFDAWKINLSNYSKNLIASKYPAKLEKDIWNYNPLTKQGGDNIVNYDIPRENWKVIDFDSEEKTGEGANNGRAIFVLDGDLSTFWHTEWDARKIPYPHHITFDMGKAYMLNGVYITNRQTAPGTYPKDFEVWAGDSPDALAKVNTNISTLQNTKSQQEVSFNTPLQCRYFKIIFKNGYGDTFTAIAEIGAF